MFSEHGIPEVLHSDIGPQYASVQFANFCTSWGISHKTSSPHYLQSNRFAKACVKFAKHALQGAKYSGANPHLALVALQAMPIDENSCLQQNCCTNTDSEQPFLPRYATVTQQPCKSMSRLTHAPKLSNHRLINAAKHLPPCMLVNQLQHTTLFKSFGFLLL